MVQVSDGKSRPRPARLVLTMDAVTVQREAPVPVQPTKDKNVPHARVSHSYIKSFKKKLLISSVLQVVAHVWLLCMPEWLNDILTSFHAVL